MPVDKPVITLALQTQTPAGSTVWNLHTADGNLIGWTPDLPNSLTTQPSCFQYRTGNHREVTFAPGARAVKLEP